MKIEVDEMVEEMLESAWLNPKIKTRKDALEMALLVAHFMKLWKKEAIYQDVINSLNERLEFHHSNS